MYILLIAVADGAYVDEFYNDSVIFITGGTGFIGKVLVEKLLRIFSIKRIYLLVRVKNNMTVAERLLDFFQESVVAPVHFFARVDCAVYSFSECFPLARSSIDCV